MDNENKNLFSEAESVQQKEQCEGVSIAVPELKEPIAEESQQLEEVEIDTNFEVALDDKTPKEKKEQYGVKEEADGRILTIKKVEIKPPRVTENNNGVISQIPPKKTRASGAEYYESKLAVMFEEDNLIEYYPTIRFWVNDGKISPKVTLDRKGHSKVSQLIRLIMQKMSKNAFNLESGVVNERPTLLVTKDTMSKFDEFSETVSDAQILKFLEGKKVKISTSTGNYAGREWFRNDIIKIE